MQSVAHLDREYSPSLHTRRFQECAKPHERVLEHFVEVTAKETLRVRAKYNIRENIRYGGQRDNQILDIYYKDYEQDSPIFVYIHGGYWQCLDKSTSGSFVAPLVECGYRVILADYNLCPQVTLEELTQQMWQFCEWVYRYAEQTNASKISFCGHSAGAHLISLWLNTKFTQLRYATRTASVFLISGIYDLRKLWRLESANPQNILALDAAKALQLSPLFRDLDDKQLIQFCADVELKLHILVAANDSATFRQQSHDYAEKLRQSGLATIFQLFATYDHFDIIEDVAREGSAIGKYILDNL